MANTVSLQLEQGEMVQVVSRNTEKKPPFIMIGIGRSVVKGKGKKERNLIFEVSKMSSAESFSLLALVDNRIYLSKEKGYLVEIRVDKEDMTKYQKKLFMEGIPKLLRKDLIRRVKRGVYIINPMAIIPSNFIEAETKWNKVPKYKR